MSNFTPLIAKEYEFEGDTVSVEFSRLKRKHMIELLPNFMDAAHLSEEEGEEQVGIDVVTKILEFGDVIATEYIHTFKGLKDSKGEDVLPITIFEEFYFSRLANSIVLDIITESFANSKNS